MKKSFLFSASGLLVTLLALAAVILTYWYFSSQARQLAYAFDTTVIDKGSIERSVSATGSVQALITADVSSQLSGQMAAVYVDFNTKVKTGDVLAVIDQQTFKAKVQSAEANLAIAKANVEVQQATIVKMQALAEQAQRDAARQKTLVERNAASQAALDTSETSLATTRADLEVARANLTNAKALISQREAELFQARLDLSRTELKSPIDGVVIARNIDPGGTVAASLQAPVLFQIAQDLSEIQIETQVDEADIGSVEAANDVTFTVDAYPEQMFSGKVEQVRIAGTSLNNVVTYTVVVRAGNPRQKLLPGMTATVRIITGTRRNVLRVPNSAIRFTPPGAVLGNREIPRPNRDDAIVASLSEKLQLTPDQQEKFRSGLAALRNESPRTAAPQEPPGERPEPRRGDRERFQDGAAGGERGQRRANGERGSGNGDQAGRRATRRGTPRGQGRISRVLEGILTAEQMKLFKDLRDEWRETTRPGIVWLEMSSGLEPRRIRLGLADESYSEVISGDLEAGQAVITRARAQQQP